MKAILFIGLFLSILPVFSQQKTMKTPTELTQEFIVDYKKWNDFAYAQKDVEGKPTDSQIEKMYDDIILKYCSPNKTYQGLAYGSESDHCPEQEKILEETVDGTRAIVKTTFTNKKFAFIAHDYEYHFMFVDSKWILEELYLVDKEGKYKSL